MGESSKFKTVDKKFFTRTTPDTKSHLNKVFSNFFRKGRGRNLPWMRKITLVVHKPPAIMRMALFLFQIAMLVASISLCFGRLSQRITVEDAHAKNNQQRSASKGQEGQGLEKKDIRKCKKPCPRIRGHVMGCSRVGKCHGP